VVNAGNGAAGHVIDAIEQKFKNSIFQLNLSKFIMKQMAISQMGFQIQS
jgi:hypothetical protein